MSSRGRSLMCGKGLVPTLGKKSSFILRGDDPAPTRLEAPLPHDVGGDAGLDAVSQGPERRRDGSADSCSNLRSAPLLSWNRAIPEHSCKIPSQRCCCDSAFAGDSHNCCSLARRSSSAAWRPSPATLSWRCRWRIAPFRASARAAISRPLRVVVELSDGRPVGRLYRQRGVLLVPGYSGAGEQLFLAGPAHGHCPPCLRGDGFDDSGSERQEHLAGPQLRWPFRRLHQRRPPISSPESPVSSPSTSTLGSGRGTFQRDATGLPPDLRIPRTGQ